MPLYKTGGGGGSDLPQVQPGKVLGTSDTGELVWVDPQSKFRGAWESDSLAAFFDFSSGVIPSNFTLSVTGAGVLPVAVAVATPLTNYTSAVRFNSGNIQQANGSSMRLSLASLGIPGITRLTAWISAPAANNSQFKATQIVKNEGSAVVSVPGSSTGVPWAKHEAACNSNDVIDFRQVGTHTSTAALATPSYLTGIDIYATARPYMRGEYVTHGDRMWRSELDNNPGQPGVSGWTQALDLPVASGVTASRPSAGLVGAGYPYYDTTLGKPIWSNGTGWTDATGTVV